MIEGSVRATAFSKLTIEKLRLSYDALLIKEPTLTKIVIAKSKKKEDIIVLLRGLLLQCQRIKIN